MDSINNSKSKLSYEELLEQNTQLKNQIQELEEISKKVEGKHQNIIESSPLGVHLYTLEDEDRLIFKGYNKSAVTILGVELESLIGKTIEDAFPPLAQTEIPVEYKKTAKTGKEFFTNQVEYDLDKIKGAYEVRAYQVSKNNIAVNFSDISERLKKEVELKESERKFRILTDNTNNWEYWMNENNEYVFISPSCKKITGYSEEEFYKNPDLFMELVREDYKDEVFNHYHDTNRTKPLYTSEFPILNKNNKEVWIEHSCIPIFDKEGKFLGRRGNNRDITKRKKFLEEKIRIEQLLNETARLAKIGGWELDVETMTSYYSQETKRIYGIPEDADPPKGTEGIKYYPKEAQQELQKLVQDALEKGTPYDVELPFINEQGKHLWVRTIGIPEKKDGKVARIFGTFHDITEKKKSEEELLLKNIVFDTSISANSTSDKKWNINKCKYSLLNLWGYESSDEVIGKSIAEFIKYEHDATKIINSLNKNEYWSGEYTALKKDGSEFIALANASSIKDVKSDFIGYQSSVIDITDRKQAELELIKAKEKAEESEKALKQSGDLMKYIIEHNRSAVAVHDKDFKYIYVSQRYLEEYNLKGKNIIGKHHYDVFPDLPQKWRDVHKKALLGNVSSADDDPYYKDDGTVVWTRWECRPWYENDNTIGGFIVYTEVITERKKMELELITAKEKAEHSDRLKSAFLANMSHEIRTPMNGILGFTSLLQDSNLSVENQKDYIDIIEKSGNRLLNTVNDIIEISRIESGETKITESEVDIIGHLDTLVTFFIPEAEKKNIDIILQNDFDRNDLTIATDKNKLSSILSNLIKNAIKYTNKGTIKVGLKVENNQILFSCQDTGIGIPKSRQEAIFNRFVQADIEDKQALQGSGLGLAIVKSYVEIMDGKVWVESEEGQGSKFYVSLPYQHKKKKEQKILQEVKSSDSGIKNINVLIAEDEEYSSMHLSILIKDKVKNINTAKNGIEAIDACKNDSGIDLILMDIRMPVMDGIEATKKIREFNKGVVIIAQTAYALEGDKEKALNAGCNDYISKPIKKDKLFELINKYF